MDRLGQAQPGQQRGQAAPEVEGADAAVEILGVAGLGFGGMPQFPVFPPGGQEFELRRVRQGQVQAEQPLDPALEGVEEMLRGQLGAGRALRPLEGQGAQEFQLGVGRRLGRGGQEFGAGMAVDGGGSRPVEMGLAVLRQIGGVALRPIGEE